MNTLIRRALFAGLTVSMATLGAHETTVRAHQDAIPDRHFEAHAAVRVRHATVAYRDVSTAEAAGYGQFLTCVREPGQGSMGTHWVNGDLVSDAVIDPDRPEAVMYETRRNGSLALIGVEYIVFQDLWDADHDQPPMLFGREFHLVGSPNRYGIPAFYALHVWAWKHNPSGVFADWNPRVTCSFAEGEPI